MSSTDGTVMTTLLELRTDVRARLDEVVPAFWTDGQLNTWINEGLRDVARRSETLFRFDTTLQAMTGQAKYPLPTDCLRVYRLEFIPQGAPLSQTYPLIPSDYYSMDQRWGSWQTTQRSYPSWFVLWGRPPTIVMQVFPVPSQAGNFNIFYYGLPTKLVNDNDVADIVEGWQDLVSLYCEFTAFRKDRDDRWKDSKMLYEESLAEMIDKTRKMHDQAGQFSRGWEPVVLPWGGMEFY